MTITAKTASRTVHLISFCGGSPERALGDCNMQLRALGNYTDRHLETVRDVLRLIVSAPTDARKSALIGKLTTIANSL